MTPIEWILVAGCKATGVTVRAIRSARRYRFLVDRRRFIARKMFAEGYGLSAIGRAFGGRDHATIKNLLEPKNRRSAGAARRGVP